MESRGFAGRVLHVDLTTGKIEKELLDFQKASRVIGGWGMNAQFAYEMIVPGIHAYAPESPIIMGAGVLCGTLSPCSDKAFVTYKCPATGVVGTAVGGMRFGSALKWAGYDHLIITGRAEKPSYLRIVDDEVDLCDAGNLWGQNVDDATDELNRRHGGKTSVVCIGPAGEKLVNIAVAFINKASTFGRTLGGVMGSKNLKAIAVDGRRGLRVADHRTFMKNVDLLTGNHLSDPLREQWIKLGLFSILPVWAKAGHFVSKNGSQVYPENDLIERFDPEIYERLKRHTIACTGCMAGDKSALELRDGKYAGQVASFSEPIIAVMSFAAHCGIDSLDKALACLNLADRYGVDGMGFGNLMDWATELYERGTITIQDTGGIELERNYETVVTLLEQVAMNVGFGAVLAEGWQGAIRRIGRDSERFALQIKGGDPDFDPRVTFGVETLGQATNPRAAHDMPVGGMMIALGRKPDFYTKMAKRMGFPDNDNLALTPPGTNLGRYLAHYENWCTILNSLGICFRMQSSRLYDASICADLYSSATGMEMTSAQLVEAADRAYNVYKAVNVLHGFDRKDDKFPEKWLKESVRFGERELELMDYFKTTTITREDFERILDSYYEEKGWDIARGVPTTEKLRKLGLDKIADDLAEAGILD